MNDKSELTVTSALPKFSHSCAEHPASSPMHRIARFAIALVAAAFSAASVAQSVTGTFPILTPSPLVYGITAGPDGNVWFAESNSNKVGRITPTGVITEFSTATAGSAPNQITTGADGNLWTTLEVPNAIGRVTPTGVVTEFPVLTGNSHVNGIVAGPDGNVWFAEENANKIGRITPSGVVTEFATPTAGSDPINITAGPDGNLWFTETNVNKIGRITTAGVITEFTLPGPGEPFGITGGPDGNVWYTKGTAIVGRITPAGVITEFVMPLSGGEGITTGPDGNLWAVFQTSMIRVTPAGVPTQFALPGGGIFVTTGPDGNLWITASNSITRFDVGAAALPLLSIDNVTANEGNSGTTAFVFTVTLSAASASTVMVNYATSNGSAIAGSDYASKSGTLTFSPGTLTQTISVDVTGDTNVEPNETFFVTLSSPVNAVLGTAQGTGTIVNDDAAGPPPPPSAAIPIPTLSEWGLAVLAMVAGALGIAGMRRRPSRR